MIRSIKKDDIDEVMQIWLNTNINTHIFIEEKYWIHNFDIVKEMLSYAEIYVYEDKSDDNIKGFIGITDNYIEGIFILNNMQGLGIGKKLLDYVKNKKNNLTLNVYNKNMRAVDFYKREGFEIKSQNIDENTKEKQYFMLWEIKY